MAMAAIVCKKVSFRYFPDIKNHPFHHLFGGCPQRPGHVPRPNMIVLRASTTGERVGLTRRNPGAARTLISEGIRAAGIRCVLNGAGTVAQ